MLRATLLASYLFLMAFPAWSGDGSVATEGKSGGKEALQRSVPSTAQFSSPLLTPDDVLPLAQKYIQDQCIDPQDYTLDGVSFHYMSAEWTLFYESKSLAIGDHFMVRVTNDASPAFKLVPGL